MATTPANRTRFWLVRGVAVLAVVLLLVLFGRQLATYVPQFVEYIRGLGAIGPVIFILGYVVAAVLAIPGSILTLAAGAIFGLVYGVVYVFVGAVLGATAAFLLSRYVLRNQVERRLAQYPRFEAVDKAIADQGRRIVFLIRLSPAFPFAILNYALGLTRISLMDYTIAHVGMLPGTILYVYYGKLAGDVATIAGGTSAPRDTAYYMVLALGLVATVVVTTIVTRTARTALRSATEPPVN